MKKIILPICGAAFLSLAALSSGASAGSLSQAGTNLVHPSAALESSVETVAWRRVCRPVPIWRHGRRVMVQQCTNVRVGPGPRPGYGRPVAPPPGRPGYQGGMGGPAPGPGWGR